MYQFPVTDKYEAKEVTQPDYQPDLFDQHELYINLDDVRGERYLTEMLFDLNIDTETFQLRTRTREYTKILFSGHRGCGKSAELMRLHKRLNNADSYASVLINLEEDAHFSRFQTEDFYLLLVLKLIEKMSEHGISTNISSLKRLADKLQVTEDIKKELTTSFKGDASAEAGGGFDLLGFLKVKTNFKSVFSGENKSSTFIRQEIKRNINDWINDFNLLLVDVREAFENHNVGKDLLFIIDGSEKLRPEIYKELFVTNGYLIQNISVNMILAVPINAYYNIIDSPQTFHSRVVIPMIPTASHEANNRLKNIITKRIDQDTFLENDAFDFLIDQSGGCIRQLLILVNRAIVIGAGSRINLENAQLAAKDLGNRMQEGLTSDHVAIIKSLNTEEDVNTGDPLVRELLYGLILLKYNGPGSIKLNPVLEGIL